MFKSLVLSATGTGLMLAMVLTVSAAAADVPKAVDLLFEGKHIAQTPVGTELNYTFERKPSDEKMLGPGYKDSIKLKIDGESAEGKKNILIEMFTGDRARDPFRSTDHDGNPMLIVYLDTALGHFRQLAGGDHSYLKHKFSTSFEKGATVSPVKISYKGADVAGYRVTVTPYANDPARSKMKGWEAAEFSIVISDNIPGKFAQMISNFRNSDKLAPSLEERTTLDGVGEVK